MKINFFLFEFKCVHNYAYFRCLFKMPQILIFLAFLVRCWTCCDMDSSSSLSSTASYCGCSSAISWAILSGSAATALGYRDLNVR